MCRLLGLAPVAQKYIFDFFMAMLTYVIDDAKKTGKYDEGIVDVKGTSVTLMGEPQVRGCMQRSLKPSAKRCEQAKLHFMIPEL